MENKPGHIDTETQSDTRPKQVPVSEKDNAPSRQIHGWRWVVAYSAMLSTTFLFALDNTIVANLQPPIINDFGNVELLPWIGTGFALGSMVILPWGKAYGIFNIKYLYIFNIVLFEVGSVICGAAPNMTALIIGRVIAGVGGSGMYSGTLTYVSVSTSMEERPAYLSGCTVMWGIGSVLGPVVGGGFAISNATWRWGFYINLVVGGVFAPAYLLLLPSIEHQPVQSFSNKCRRIDWINTVIFLAGAVCLTVAITFGGVVYSFQSGTIITLWVATGVFFVAFTFTLKYHPFVERRDRLYPAHFLKQPTLLNMQLQVFLSSGIILAMTYYVPLYFQFVRGDGPLDAGVRLLPLIISMVLVSMINGVLLPKTPYISPWYIGGSAIMLVGCGLMYTVNERTAISKVYGYNILIGAGAGCYIVAGFGIVQSLVAAEEIPDAVGAMTISQVLGMVLCLAIGGTMFHHFALNNVAEALPTIEEADLASLISGTSSRAFAALSPEQQSKLIPELADALTSVWVLFLAAAALSFVFSVPLLTTRLGGPQERVIAGDS